MNPNTVMLFSGCGFSCRPARVVYQVNDTYLLVEVDEVGYYLAEVNELRPAAPGSDLDSDRSSSGA